MAAKKISLECKSDEEIIQELKRYAKRKYKQAMYSKGMEDPYIGSRDLVRKFSHRPETFGDLDFGEIFGWQWDDFKPVDLNSVN